MENSEFKQWAILELMGHRKLGGLVTEETRFGTNMLRIDVFIPGCETAAATQYYTAASVYCLTPTTEDIARRYAKGMIPAPVSRYELAPIVQVETPGNRNFGGSFDDRYEDQRQDDQE
jgi:hypothetical protein